ncbi:MAG TPA: FtsW/RodA/SpoVE family cell cycle protein [Chitinophagales bacterium]|nr:FtsW/RodA/SpoVE family cell cycle protein [Chitinophagales bacterium]HRK28707.1 FtsW/RodA/SpoVE family cell cycle protein [Chitinophagales bacterium]
MQLLLNKLHGDRTIWLIVILLSLFSILGVYSATGSLAYRQMGGNTEYYLLKQLFITGFGLLLMYLSHRVNHLYYSRIAQVMLYISVPLLALTLFFGTEINDAKRWITLPVLNISFQTSDFAKLALIMYTSRMLSRKQHIIKDFDRSFVPIVLPMVIICMLIVPANFSTAALLFTTCVILMFIGRVHMRHIILTLWLGVSVFGLYVAAATLTGKGRVETWKSRIDSYINPTPEKQYQVLQAKIAVANGGLVRLAPGKSMQRNFLPHPYSDFIYAIIIEEYGLMAGIFIIFLYLALLYRCIRIFARGPDAFGAMLAVGLGVVLVVQALINMAVTVNLLPITGLTLPLVSMGGTSVLFSSISIGIILSVSRTIQKNELATN